MMSDTLAVAEHLPALAFAAWRAERNGQHANRTATMEPDLGRALDKDAEDTIKHALWRLAGMQAQAYRGHTGWLERRLEGENSD